MTKSERVAASVGLGILALALLPGSTRGALLDGLLVLANGVVRKKLSAESDAEVWEDIDVSEWTIH